jgi:nicotinamidase-related amidase
MRIYDSNRRKALIVVDVQPSFLCPRNEYIVNNILALVDAVTYDLYVEATFHAEEGSLWNTQQHWICPVGKQTETIPQLAETLRRYNAVKVSKVTKSVFKGDKEVLNLFNRKGIQEVHVVGLETNDCVLATALESFDFGFVTYVIEECCQSSSLDELHQDALKILRRQNMTNGSCIESVAFVDVK